MLLAIKHEMNHFLCFPGRFPDPGEIESIHSHIVVTFVLILFTRLWGKEKAATSKGGKIKRRIEKRKCKA